MSQNQIQSLRYAKWNDAFATEKPYIIVSHMPWLEESQRTNVSFIQGPKELIRDIRGREDEFTLDDHGFRFVDHSFGQFNVVDEEEMKRVFYPDAEVFLKRHVEGVDRVMFFDYRVRSNEPEPREKMVDIADHSLALPPARGVHIDQSPGGALKRVQMWTGDEAETLLNGRVRILNIWVPYDHAVEDCPLALCDGSTVQPENMLVTDHITRTYIGETVYPMYDPCAKWYYLSDQRPDEVLILKIFDSDEHVPARYTPHTSFELENKKPNARPRKSFELRALVFTYPQTQEHAL